MYSYVVQQCDVSHVGMVVYRIKKYMEPLPATYRMLRDFYAPFNKRLVEMLGDNRWLQWEEELVKYVGQHAPDNISIL